MKTLFYNFSQGIDAMTDRRMLPNGFAVVMDNVDLRTGYAKPFKAPSYSQAADTTTTRIWEFLGKWYLSDLYRDYTGEVTQTQQRIYYAEEGPGHVAPQKIVNDVQDTLGTPVPQAPLLVSDGAVTIPRNLTLTQIITGNLSVSTLYAYRVAARMANGTQQPCQESQITLDSTHRAVYLTWDSVDNAVGYVVFGRIGGQEQFLKDVGLQLFYLDDGTASPSGVFASTYDVNVPYTYVYTYVRSVGTMEDESGPSPLSVVLNTGNGRVLTRQVQVDGFMDGATVITTGETTLASQFSSTITGMLYQSGGTILTFSTEPSGPWNTGDGLRVIDNGSGGSGKDYSINGQNMTFDRFTTSFPAPSTLTVQNGGVLTSLLNGTYIYKITSVIGSSTGGATSAASAATSPWLVIGTAPYLSWLQVPGASYYQIFRSGDAGVTWDRYITVGGGITNTFDFGGAEATGVTPPTVDTTVTNSLLVRNVDLTLTVPQPVASSLKAWLGKTVVLNATAQLINQNDSVVLAGATQSQLNGVLQASFNAVDLIVDSNINVANPGTSTWDGITLPVSTDSVPKLLLLTAQSAGSENGPWAFNGSSNPLTRPQWWISTLPAFTGKPQFPQVYIRNGVVNAGKLWAIQTTGAITVDTTATTWALATASDAFFIAKYSASDDTFTSLSLLSGIGNYTYWRIYRSGDTPNFLLVAQVPVSQASYEDTVPTTGLGVTLPTSYTDNGFVVTFQPPSSDMQQPELFNGMLFMHAANVLSWSPIGLPDAFPVAFQLTFSYPILHKAAFASGLIVMCQDAIYRLDGFSPTTLGLQKTLIEDGLIAPRSVQKTSHGLLYLARRGVMLTDGNTAVCLTDTKLPYSFFIQPGTYTEPYVKQDFWWYTTDHTVGYASLAWDSNSPIAYQNTLAATIQADVPQQGPIYGIRSFNYRGKYFLYYSDDAADYKANTMACVDLVLPERPVTLLGAKVIDAHVTAMGDAFVLLGNDGSSSSPSDFAETLVQQIGIPPFTTTWPIGPKSSSIGVDGDIYSGWISTALTQITADGLTQTIFAGSFTIGAHTDANGTSARFESITDCEWGTDNNLYVTDPGNISGHYGNYIRKVDTSANVTTLCTIPTTTSAIGPIAIRPTNGYIYTMDNTSIWEVDLAGVMTAVAVSPVATGTYNAAMAFNGTGDKLYIVDPSDPNPWVMTVPGHVVTHLTSSPSLGTPTRIKRKAGNTFYVADDAAVAVKVFDASGNTLTLFHTFSASSYPNFCIDAAGEIVFFKFTGSFGTATFLYNLIQTIPGHSFLQDFVGSEAQFNVAFTPTATDTRSIYKWEGSDQRIPIFIRTGEFNVGMPHDRKFWGSFNFHGEGTAQIRVYNDGVLIANATLDAREAPNKPRRINLPLGTKGYGISYELVGDYNHRATELCYDLMPNQGGDS